MSLLPVNSYRRRSKDNTVDDDVFGNDFELFDPWMDLDLNMPKSFRWINQPKHHQHHRQQEDKIAPALLPPPSSAHGEKYRVKLDISGFDPETIKTKIDARHLVVEAKRKSHSSNSNDNKALEKRYDLPEHVYEHADAEHLVSYVTPNNILIVEIPIRNPEHEHRKLQSQGTNDHHLVPYGQNRDQLFDYNHFHTSVFTPKIVDVDGQQKKLQMILPMKNYRPEQIKVSVKNNELIIQGEHVSNDSQHSEKFYFYRSVTLPPGTQTDHLQTHLTQDGQLKIEAPFNVHNK
ncbi:unnamed protein product [Didymodactylos carnosus]|uniref:SHSP domain-containing protein n=2 Tax=Didymodactylos carnosus TaxID=1234261 RepID=A0A815HMW7_9BILA|nr:unnamed protein product [Didymodactylos carnosus]CAF4230029.1 unnamed protein product [Didymodactylos carnosus]